MQLRDRHRAAEELPERTLNGVYSLVVTSLSGQLDRSVLNCHFHGLLSLQPAALNGFEILDTVGKQGHLSRRAKSDWHKSFLDLRNGDAHTLSMPAETYGACL